MNQRIGETTHACFAVVCRSMLGSSGLSPLATENLLSADDAACKKRVYSLHLRALQISANGQWACKKIL